MRRLLMAALAAGLAGLAALGAATPLEARAGDEAGLVAALRAKGAEVLPLGARGGLDGYFVTPASGAGYSLYLTSDGHAVAGLLYAPDGTEVTGIQFAAAHKPGAGGDASRTDSADTTSAAAMTAHATADRIDAPASTASSTIAREALFERSADAFGFTLGASGPVVVLFGDAACPWSRAAAAKLATEALAGRLRLRVVPVGVLGAGAAQQAAAIAASPDPARAWFEGTAREADRRGAVRIARNNALLDAWGAAAVPLIVWRTGGSVLNRIGDIDDVPAWLERSFGPQTPVPVTLRAGDPRAEHPRAEDPRAEHPRAEHPRGGGRP